MSGASRAVVRKRAAAPARSPLARQRAEAMGEAIKVEHNGITYDVPPPMDWPVDVTEYLAEDNIPKVMVEILGRDQWDMFRSKGGADGQRATLRDLKALFDAVMEYESGE